MGIYSHSKIQTFEQCHYKYKLKYIDKIEPEISSSIEAHLGNCIHNTFEWIYTNILSNKIPILDEVIEFFTEKWTEEETENLLIVKQNLNSKDYFNKGISFLVDYYTEHHPFDEGTIELEKKIMIKLGEHYLIGYIDRLSKNKETGEIEIHDYKTSNSLPSREKIEEDRQLAFYSIAIKEIFGKDIKIKLIWHYLAHKTKITSERTEAQLEELKNNILEIIKEIENTKDFPPNQSILCDWCEYKSLCPLHNKEIKRETQTELTSKYPTISKYLRD
jgi:putative RecB family exonuclease